MKHMLKHLAGLLEADNRSLQVLEKDDLVAVELGVKPPMQGSANTAMKGVNLAPGSFNVTETEDGIKPLFQVGVNLQHLHEKIQQLEERIKRAYSADLFRMFTQAQNDKNMTARRNNSKNTRKFATIRSCSRKITI